jgi:hypothetical protein
MKKMKKINEKTNKQHARAALTREKMLEVAIEAFATRGYEGIGTRELADRAGGQPQRDTVRRIRAGLPLSTPIKIGCPGPGRDWSTGQTSLHIREAERAIVPARSHTMRQRRIQVLVPLTIVYEKRRAIPHISTYR